MGERVARDEKKVGNLDEFHCSKHADRLLDFFSFYLEKRKKKNSGGKAKARIRERSLDPRAGRKKRERSFSKLGLPLRLVSLVLTLLEREEVGISPGKNEPV